MTLSKTEWHGEKESIKTQQNKRKNAEGPANRAIKTMPQNNFQEAKDSEVERWRRIRCQASACWPTWLRRELPLSHLTGPPRTTPIHDHKRRHIDKGVETCDFVIDTKKPLIGTLTLLMLWQISPKDRGPVTRAVPGVDMRGLAKDIWGGIKLGIGFGFGSGLEG